MQEQGKNQSSRVKSFTQEHKKQKVCGSASMLEHEKGTSAVNEAKSFVKHAKGARLNFSSDVERNLDGVRYRLGDMVWAKVKSHPWWPGQLYDPALASASAMELKRDNCFLVAFFGDSTFNWFAEAELIPYEPNFPQKSRQTSAPNFLEAVQDSLDEVHRRMKSGLTCHCCKSESASENGEAKAGLLYDRQMRDIRRTFEPAKMLANIKKVALSPNTYPRNMLQAVAGGQADAFRLLYSRKSLLEHKGSEGLAEIPQGNHMKANDAHTILAEVSKNKTMQEKVATKKHQQKGSSMLRPSCEQEDGIRKQSEKEKHGGLVEVGKAKQHSKGVSFKKGSTEKSRGSDGVVEGVTTDATSENRILQPVEHAVQDKQTISPLIAKPNQASTATSKERSIRESEESPEQSERYKASTLFEKDIPCVVSGHSLDTGKIKAQKRKLKKSAGLTENDKSMVSVVDVTGLAVPIKEPKVALKKAKVAMLDEDQVSKAKTMTKLAAVDVESSQLMKKKLKVVSVGKDRVFKQPNRFFEAEPTVVVDVLPREIKKRKLLPESRGKDNVDYTPGGHIRDSVVSDSVPSLVQPQQADEVISDATGLKCNLQHPQVDSLASMKTGAALPSEMQGMAIEVGRLPQEEILQGEHVVNDALEGHDVGAGLVRQANELEAGCKLGDSPQTEITSSMFTKKKEKVLNCNVIELRKISTVQAGAVSFAKKRKKKNKDMLEDIESNELLKLGGPSYPDKDVYGEVEGESLKTSSKVIEDQNPKDLSATNTGADPSLVNIHGTRSVESFVTCSVMENMQDATQTKQEVPFGKIDQEERKSLKATIEAKDLPSFSKISSSKKRAMEECRPKGFVANSKRIRTGSMEGALESHTDFVGRDDKQYKGLNRRDEESTCLQNLHEGLLSLATEPLDAANEEFYSAVHRTFMSFRKVVYKKAVYYTDPECSGTLSAAAAGVVIIENDKMIDVVTEQVAAPEVVIDENDKMTDLVREQVEVQAISKDHSFEAEPSKFEDARTQEGSVSDVFVSHKQSEEGTTSTLKSTKKSITVIKTPSSSSISLRPAFEAKIPVRGPKEVLNRFGQRVPRLVDAGERLTSPSSRAKGCTSERALVISFAPVALLPSERQLREVFAKFGDLNASLTRIDPKSRYAQVIFRHTQDAEAALSSLKENPVFENARFWLKPRDAERRDIVKQSSRNAAIAERPDLSASNKPQAKIDSDKVRTKTASGRGLLVSPNDVIRSDTHKRDGDKSSATQNFSSRKIELSGKGAMQSNHGIKSASLSLNTSASQNGPVGVSGHGRGKQDELHPSVVSSSSVLPGAGPRSLGPPAAIDISEPLLALLHHLHDLVVTTGFVF